MFSPKEKNYDDYMSTKYADSSSEDEMGNGALPKCANLKFKRQKTRITKDKNNTLSYTDYTTDTERPSLNVPVTCDKKDLIISNDIKVCGPINQYLREYQRHGVQFMLKKYKERTGCILADDMGLGKTIQVIAFVAALLKKTGIYKDDHIRKSDAVFLVVAPTSVLYNWLDELNVWGFFKVGKFHRSSKDDVIDMVKKGKLEIVLTTHETMRIYISTLEQIKWTAIIFDEAHRIKSKDALLTKTAKQLKSRCKIGLTGTPLQNQLKELWCLLDWANPGCLGNYDNFDRNFAQPMYIGQRFTATKRELATARKKQQELSLLHKRWMLRRTKEMISDQLPEKDEKIVFCKLSSIQVSIYEAILELPKVKMLLGLDTLCKCGSNMNARKCCFKKFDWRRWLFPYMQLLLKISNHAALLLPNSQTEEQKEMANQLCSSLFKRYPRLETLCKKQNLSEMSNPIFCGKMIVLQKLLNVLQKKVGDKVLIFSHSVQLLNILEAYIISCGMIYRRLDGSTPVHMRNDLVKEFNRDTSIFVCLVSTTAGSLGLNFVGANVVIIFDPMWNPTYDQQAQDRAYRIGQQRNVHVYRLISIGTIEENIYMRQIYKQQLSNIAVETSNEPRYFSGIPGNKRCHGELFGISNMFKFNSDHTSIFAKQVLEKVKDVENDITMAKYVPFEETSTNKDTNNTSDIASQDITDDSDISDIDPIDYLSSQILNDSLNPPLRDNEEESDGSVSKQDKYTKLNKRDNVYTDILGDCGIDYAHSTRSVIGANQRETDLTHKAIQDVFWDGVNSQQLANENTSTCGSSSESDITTPSTKTPTTLQRNRDKSPPIKHQSTRVFERINKEMFIIGSTPPALQEKQFQEISNLHGYSTIQEFAQFIVKSEPTDYKKILRDFYENTQPNLRLVSSYEKIYKNSKNNVQINVAPIKTRKAKIGKNLKSTRNRLSKNINIEDGSETKIEKKVSNIKNGGRARYMINQDLSSSDSEIETSRCKTKRNLNRPKRRRTTSSNQLKMKSPYKQRRMSSNSLNSSFSYYTASDEIVESSSEHSNDEVISNGTPRKHSTVTPTQSLVKTLRNTKKTPKNKTSRKKLRSNSRRNSLEFSPTSSPVNFKGRILSPTSISLNCKNKSKSSATSLSPLKDDNDSLAMEKVESTQVQNIDTKEKFAHTSDNIITKNNRNSVVNINTSIKNVVEKKKEISTDSTYKKEHTQKLSSFSVLDELLDSQELKKSSTDNSYFPSNNRRVPYENNRRVPCDNNKRKEKEAVNKNKVTSNYTEAKCESDNDISNYQKNIIFSPHRKSKLKNSTKVDDPDQQNKSKMSVLDELLDSGNVNLINSSVKSTNDNKRLYMPSKLSVLDELLG